MEIEGKPLITTGETVLTSDWTDDTVTSGFWYADISNANITTSSSVDVTYQNAYKSIVDAASFSGRTDELTGKVRIYAESQPTDTIVFDLRIFI